MKRIRAAIIDDQLACINTLANDLKAYDFIDVTLCETSPVKAMEKILEDCPDLIFIDVQMPQMSGLEFVKQLHGRVNPSLRTVFFSAYDKYILDALRLSAFDYLVKPYTKEELDAVIERIVDTRDIDSILLWNSLSSLLDATKRVALETNLSIKYVHINEIVLFSYDSRNRKWTALLSDSSSCRLSNSITSSDILRISSVFTKLTPDKIVNLEFVSAIEPKTMVCILKQPFGHLRPVVSRRSMKILREKCSTL